MKRGEQGGQDNTWDPEAEREILGLERPKWVEEQGEEGGEGWGSTIQSLSKHHEGNILCELTEK